ncbi:MAG: methionyl-tRNA formyltransferase [Rubrivivax sp.]
MSLRVAFAGTPEFARHALQAIGDAGHTVPVILTQPDRPAGRGMKLQASAVKQLAVQRGWPVLQPRSLRLDGRFGGDAQAAQSALRQAGPDVLVVAAYGLILPAWVLALPKHGGLNIHASLLPRWRGAAPIQRAIEAGDSSTGITLMQMDIGLDTGDTLLAEALPIGASDTAATLGARLATLGARLIVHSLRQLEAHALAATPQPAEGGCYAHKIDKAEAAIDWRDSASLIERRTRAFDPFPGATFHAGDALVKLWRAAAIDRADANAAPGTVSVCDDQTLVVACGDGALSLLQLQCAGGRRIGTAQFLRTAHGAALRVGDVLPSSTRRSIGG